MNRFLMYLICFTIYSLSMLHAQSWQNLNFPISATLAAININNNTVYGTTNGVGVVRSTDGGATWISPTANQPPGQFQHFTCTNTGTLLAGMLDFASTYGTPFPLMRSTDGGVTWTYIAQFTYSTSKFYNAPNNYIYCVASSNPLPNRLLRSTDDGLTFTQVADKVIDIAIAANNDIYAIRISSSKNTLAKSTDKGQTWANLSATGMTALPNRIIRCPNGNIFVTDGSNSNSVTRSLNGGISFESIGNILPLIWTDVNNNLFAFKPNKAYRSIDNGTTWQDISLGLSSNLLGDVMSHPNGSVYGSAIGKIYKLIGTTSVDENLSVIPGNFSLSQNYPNPFNPSTVINYQLSAISHVRLNVYDVVGREVATLVNEYKPAGNYEVNFDASKLSSGISAKGGYASGVYFYKLQAGNFTSTKKMVLIR